MLKMSHNHQPTSAVANVNFLTATAQLISDEQLIAASCQPDIHYPNPS